MQLMNRPLSDVPKDSDKTASHTQSIIALCLAVLSLSYMLISVFPYSGFMVIQLSPSGQINVDNAGFYAGLLASSFMVGRALSSYGWGKAADMYGRITCLSISLFLSSLFSLGFGLSTTFVGALQWRFWLGVVNGVLPISKTTVSELAYGNSVLETRGMGLVMGMWGWGFLISPAMSGISAEPIKQYPNVMWLQSDHNQWYYIILAKFPFLLPNLIGALLGFLSLLAVNLYVPETLPKQHTKALKEIPHRLWKSFQRALSVIPEESSIQSDETTTLISPDVTKNNKRHEDYATSCVDNDELEDSNDEMYLKSVETLFQELDDDVEDAVSKAQASYDELSFMLSTTRNSRASISSSVRKHSTLLSQRRRQSRLSSWRASMRSSSEPEVHATMASLWSQSATRNHMIVFWLSSFVSTTVDEGFPLFCISKAGGLALSEKSIGKLLSMCGLIFALSQYIVFASLVSRFGLYGSMRISSTIMGPIVALLPISLLINNMSGEANGDDFLSTSTFIFLR
jgi:Major Facilitator Superfamily